jgi:hypothetical protein
MEYLAMMDFERPSPRFVQVAGDVALLLALDAQMLIEGRPVEAHGMRFWFVHYGERDPYGLTLFAQVGALAEEHGAGTLRRLLEFNALTPAALTGYYALVPGTDDLVCCWRWDIAEPADGVAQQIVAEISEMSRQAVEVRKAADDLAIDLFQ